MQAEKQDGKIVVTHEGKLAAVVEFGPTQTVLTIEKAFTNWSKQIVRAAKEVGTPAAPAASGGEPDDIVL